ncbi:hypothetical protein [Microbacterium sp.]|uniref:hypothetical protein n=1 Tax=Microbacterium sp. TaxID=51671 RepID=UPI0025FD2B43|nr:hypothetical protein [Microbacterium sp.]MBT9608035.1 hypothetical protein [Microbacterium sp.]
MSTETTQPGRDGSVSRRTVIKTAAWAVPVVAVAVAAPLASASTTGPEPVQPGSATTLDGGTSISTYRGGNPNEIRINQSTSGFGFFIFDANGVEYPDGTYVASTPTITVTWNGVGDYTPILRDLRGWTQSGGSTASGTTGSITFLYSGQLLNGASNRVPAPYVVLRPTTGNALGSTRATVEAAAVNFDTIDSSVTI